MLSDKEFFLKLKQYIEDAEHQIDGEWGNGRSVEQLISDGAMPDLYFQVLQRITSVAQPEPQGPPKNCWLDDEPGLCPSPCVFDDPSEVIDSCVEARCLSLEGKPKEACKYYRTTAQPEPQGPTDEELWEAYDQMDGAPEDWAWVRDYASAVLARWGRPAIEPVPVSERLPVPQQETK
jgi:hypothetical protein